MTLEVDSRVKMMRLTPVLVQSRMRLPEIRSRTPIKEV